jgi:hypothetical protein
MKFMTSAAIRYIYYVYIHALSLMTGYDASAHLSEETIGSSIAAPMATIYTGTYVDKILYP